MPMWVLLLLAGAAVAALLLWYAGRGKAAPAKKKTGIDSVTLTVTPGAEWCGSGKAMKAQVDAAGPSSDGRSRNFTINLYEDENWGVDDLLATYTSKGGVTPGTTISVDMASWSASHTLELFCTNECQVKGNKGTSDVKHTVPVYAEFILIYGQPHLEKRSASVDVTCSPGSGGDEE